MDISHDEGNGFFAPPLAFTKKMALEAKNSERSPAGGEVRFGYLLDLWFGHCTYNYILLDRIAQRTTCGYTKQKPHGAP